MIASRSDSALADMLAGAKQCLPVMLASAPFGVLYGALAVENGLSVFETVAMSALVFGGASQMVGIELFGQKVAPWLIVLSIFAVNFRHVLYSAAAGRLTRHWRGAVQALGFFFLTDPQFAETERRAETGREISVAWYFGMAVPLYLAWIADAWVGALFGPMIPDTHAFGLDFLLPIYFLGLVMGFRRRPLWLPIVAASSVASILAFLYVGSPWHVSIGAVAGVIVGAVMTPVRKAGAGDRAVEAPR